MLSSMSGSAGGRRTRHFGVGRGGGSAADQRRLQVGLGEEEVAARLQGRHVARDAFARLDQHTLGFSARVDYTVRPTLSLQLFAEPFVSAGRYTDVQALTAPDAARWADRFTPLPERDAEGFNSKRFRSNAVMRWEYRPGSTLFVVWQQGRDQGDRDPGSFEAWRDYRNLFGARPDNTLLVKASVPAISV